MTATKSITFAGWGSVTDVPCLYSCDGTIRWAENGYVPGYRICDGCGRHFELRDGLLSPNGRRDKITAADRTERDAQERIAAERQRAWDIAAANESILRNLHSDCHGQDTIDIEDIQKEIGKLDGLLKGWVNVSTVAHRRLLETLYPEAVAAWDRVAAKLTAWNQPTISMTKDGKYICLYGHGGGNHSKPDGWIATDLVISATSPYTMQPSQKGPEGYKAHR